MTIRQDLRPETIGDRLARYNNAGPGFDILRLALAVLIFYGHARGIASLEGDANSLVPSGATTEQNSFIIFVLNLKHRLFAIYVPVFFALSGFLVTGSAVRLRKAVPFLAFRALRIFPALAVEVTLSALILGPLATALPLHDYFSDHKFSSYFLNILGDVHFELPGVFTETGNSYVRLVNANLWTLPAEFYCYLITSVLLITRIFYNRTLFSILFIGATALVMIKFSVFVEMNLDRIAALDLIVYYFFLGMAFFLWRDKVILNAYVFVACIAAIIVLFQLPEIAFLMPVPLTYATVYFGCLGFKWVSQLRKHDISYGIYLYGFPITQSVAFFIPSLRGHVFPLSLIAIGLTAAFAAFSWHYIEKPALRLKRFVGSKASQKPALAH